MTNAAAPEPIPIPMAWFVAIALCVAGPEPGGPGVSGADRDVEDATGSVGVPEAVKVTEVEGETY